ncbi:MAG TPA: tellurite resistance/C4-dicarboxylate transporter family protein [Vicinamibacterales bacterium]|nr:tellurite resistance/C4-dicarboxylate transporter family protein [Vicinamibacterales bacterium]
MSAPAAAPGAGLRTLHPAYFAMVMATGIVSIAAQLVGYPLLARVLFPTNIAFAIVLLVLLFVRLMRYPSDVAADFRHHGRAVGFFTIVAATAVLGSQAIVIEGAWTLAAVLWGVAIVAWILLTYPIFTLLTVQVEKPLLADGINGGWLVSVVAPQSIAVLGAQLAAGFGASADRVLFFSLAMWLGGGMLYIWIISLIFYRYTFMTMHPSDLAPPYWINMGAVAISTLAGSFLVLEAPQSALLTELRPFLLGFTLLFWATATWWIPMLLTLGLWRHVYRRFPLRYDPLYWGAVFPLGMYTACTFRLSQALDAPWLLAIPRVTFWVALVAWAATLTGLIRRLARGVVR